MMKYTGDILKVINDLGETFHENSVKHGFWPQHEDGTILIGLRNKGEMIALMHSELSEMLEGIRNPSQDQHCPEFTSEEIEAADTIIRLLEYCHAFKLRIGEAIIAKHEYNVSRPYKHGKAF